MDHAAICSIGLGSLFLALPTRGLTGQERHLVRRVRREHRFELRLDRRALRLARPPVLRAEDHWHPVMKLSTRLVRPRRD